MPAEAPSEVGALLRREGLYSSQLTAWRRARREGSLHRVGQASRAPGPSSGPGGQRERALAPGERPPAAASGAGPDDPRDPKKSLRNPGDHPPEPAGPRRRRMRAAAEQLAATVGVAPACRALGVARGLGLPAPPAAAAPPRRGAVAVRLGPWPRPSAPKCWRSCTKHRFVDQAPAAVYASLLEEGRYLCSPRTMYRLLHGVGEVRERRRQRRHPRAEPPRLVATAPNQVWTWDITRLAGPRRGETYPLYVVLDLYSRYVVAWMVATQESAGLARRLIQAACRTQVIEPGQLTLHQDRGAPMTARSFAQLLVDPRHPGQLQPASNRRRQPLLGEPLQNGEIRALLSGPLCRPGAGADLVALVFPLV